MLLIFVGPFTVTAALVAFLPNIYRSTATILVDRQQVPEVFVRPTVTSALETRLQAITQEIMSRARLEGLISRFGLYADLKKRVSPEAVIERMRQDVQLEVRGVDPRARSTATIAFSVSYRGSDPRVVAQVTNTLASFYIEENMKVREKQATGTADFLRVQLDAIKKRLDGQEHRVSEFNARNMGELPQQLEANLGTLERLHTQLRLNTENQIRGLERRDSIAKQVGSGEWASAGSPAAGTPVAGTAEATAARLSRLRQELAELRAQYNDRYPDIVRVKREIAALEQQPPVTPDGNPKADGSGNAAPPVSRAHRVLAEMDADLAALKKEERQLRQAIAAYQKRVENAPRHEQAFQELSRDYVNTKELYRTLLNRYQEAQLAESMEQRQKGEQFRILDPAISSAEPAAPKRQQLLLMGFLLSLGSAAAAGLIAEKLDTSFHGVDDLRAAVALPVLVSVPKVPTPEALRRRRRWVQLTTAAGAVGIVLLVGACYLLARGNEHLVWVLSRGGV